MPVKLRLPLETSTSTILPNEANIRLVLPLPSLFNRFKINTAKYGNTNFTGGGGGNITVQRFRLSLLMASDYHYIVLSFLDLWLLITIISSCPS
jgi:hypothetical protein